MRDSVFRLASCVEVFRIFLTLGLTSFGGPIAHLGYFRHELVVRRRWIDEAGYADLVALCQFLPGPTSSQVGFALGLLRGQGLLGGLAAWIAFATPSAIFLFVFALGAAAFTGTVAEGFLHGLKLVAVAVVIEAIWGMAKSLTPDWQRVTIAVAAVAVLTIVSGGFAQIAAIGTGAIAGLWLCRDDAQPRTGPVHVPISRRRGTISFVLFAALFVFSFVTAGAAAHRAILLFNLFYRSGALVFGGGHVVLPLLQAALVEPGWVTNQTFLTGYGLAQAIPGPLFTFAAYLGAMVAPPPGHVAGAAIAVAAIFLPGLLLTYGMLPFWNSLRLRPGAQATMRGANAAVVGILGATLYTSVWVGAVVTAPDVLLVLAGVLLLMVRKTPPWIVVGILATAGTVIRVM